MMTIVTHVHLKEGAGPDWDGAMRMIRRRHGARADTLASGAAGGMGRLRGAVQRVGIRACLLLEPAYQFLVRAGADHPHELGMIRSHEAHASERHVEDPPLPVVALAHRERHRGGVAAFTERARADDDVFACRYLFIVGDPHAVVRDTLEIGMLDQVREEPHELRALGRRTTVPGRAQGAAGGFGKVNRALREGKKLTLPLDGAVPALEGRIVEQREDAVDGVAECLGGWSRPYRRPGNDEEHERPRRRTWT